MSVVGAVREPPLQTYMPLLPFNLMSVNAPLVARV